MEKKVYTFGVNPEENNTVALIINESNIVYEDYEGKNHKWVMKGAKVGVPELSVLDENTEDVDKESIKKYGTYYKLIIPIYNAVDHDYNKDGNNNSLDDIEITYYKKA